MTTLKPLTVDEIKAGEKLCDAATPAPWLYREVLSGSEVWRHAVTFENLAGRQDDVYFATNCDGTGDADERDARFIAAARTLLPRALADAREAIELRALLGRARLALEMFDDKAAGIQRRLDADHFAALMRDLDAALKETP